MYIRKLCRATAFAPISALRASRTLRRATGRKMSRSLASAAALALALGLPSVGVAQSGNFGLELNSVQDMSGACRVTFVATNNTGVGLTAASYEVVIWDGLGNIPGDGFLVLEFGRMPVGKTKVLQFDLPNRACSDISRILINDLAECSSLAGEHEFCLTGLVANSRSTIQFGK